MTRRSRRTRSRLTAPFRTLVLATKETRIEGATVKSLFEYTSHHVTAGTFGVTVRASSAASRTGIPLSMSRPAGTFATALNTRELGHLRSRHPTRCASQCRRPPVVGRDLGLSDAYWDRWVLEIDQAIDAATADDPFIVEGRLSSRSSDDSIATPPPRCHVVGAERSSNARAVPIANRFDVQADGPEPYPEIMPCRC